MNEAELIAEMLSKTRSIAVVGLSDRPDRSSYSVAEYLARYYEIIPVNPAIENWLGRPSYDSILALPPELPIDLVNIFRRSEYLPEIVSQVITRNRQAPSHPIRYIWTQLGVEHAEAKSAAETAGIKVIINQCLAVAHSLSSTQH